MCDCVGLKLSKDYPIARCVSVIRKTEPSLSVADINSRIKNDEYVLLYDYTDDSGIKKIIHCCDVLALYGIKPKLFERDKECDVDFLRELCGCYELIGDEIEAYKADESEAEKIFEYQLKNAWEFPIIGLSIYDRPEDNVKCLVYYATHAPKDLTLSKSYTLDGSVIKQIRAVIESNSRIFNIEEVEFPFVLDGFGNEFFFKCEDKSVRLDASNISAWYNTRMHGKAPTNAKLILKVYEKIKELLTENGVDSRYLSLEW